MTDNEAHASPTSNDRSPVCWIIAGPNGAGKSTFALEYLPTLAGCRNFVNADLIAAGLSPLAPERELLAASRLFLREIEDYVTHRENFAFETTLSGRTYLRLVRRLLQGGWRVELFHHYAPLVSRTRCFNNAGAIPELIFEQRGEVIEIGDRVMYDRLMMETGQ